MVLKRHKELRDKESKTTGNESNESEEELDLSRGDWTRDTDKAGP